MVERPIKKSERQTAAEPSPIEDSLDSTTQSPEESGTTRSFPRKNIKLEKGKGNQKEDSRAKQGNPALIRGPKPTKPKPPVIKETEASNAEDSVPEADQEITAES